MSSCLAAAAALLLLAPAPPAIAAPEDKADGTTTLPVPRFVSLKSGKAMLRAGPDDQRFPILWEYRRKGLPMEIVREYGLWREVRDPTGTRGWMNKSLLSGVRTALVLAESGQADDSGGAPRLLYTAPNPRGRIAWRAAPGAVVTIILCEDVWCRVSNAGRSGFIPRAQLWGTYPGEAVGG